MRVIFMGTPAFALPTLKGLAASEHEVVAVYTQPPRPAGRGQKDTPSPIHAFALEQHLPVYTPTSLKTVEAQEEFKNLNADIAVVVAYGLILPTPILDGTKLGCINVHPSALPRWRGAAPIQRSIMAGDKDTAIVIMQMDEGLDTGDILLTQSHSIPAHTNAGMLHDTLSEAAVPLVLKAISQLEDGTATPVPQPEEGTTYAQKISKEERRINWQQPAEVVYHHILGLSPSPGAQMEYQGEIIKILDAEFSHETTDKAPGSIVDDQFSIACSEGMIHPKELQRPGKKRMKLAEFLKGFHAL